MYKRFSFVFFSLLLIFMLSACKGKETTEEAAHPTLDSSVTFQILKTKAMQTTQAQLTLASNPETTETHQNQPDALHDSSSTPATEHLAEEQHGTSVPSIPEHPVEEHLTTIETPKPIIEQTTPLSPEPTYTPWAVNSEYDCQAELISPDPVEPLSPDSLFETHWQLTNTGTRPWDHNSIDFIYMDGARLHTGGDIIDLTENINPGETYHLYIPMQSPPQTGYFQAAWVLKRGNLYFCSLNLSLQVKP